MVPHSIMTRLAAALSRAAKQEYSPSALPFSEFEFVDGGKAIRFSRRRCTVELRRWPPTNARRSQANPNIQTNVLRRTSAGPRIVKDHNLYLRDVSTGTVLQLTHDGVAGWDYATPLPSLRVMVDQGTEDVKQPAAVFWSPDSSKLITYRIDSRNSGRFTSLQFVPPDQLQAARHSPTCIRCREKCWRRPSLSSLTFNRASGSMCSPLQSSFLFRTVLDLIGFLTARASTTTTMSADSRRRNCGSSMLSTGEQKVLVREQSDAHTSIPAKPFIDFVEGTQERFSGPRSAMAGIISTSTARPGNSRTR